MSNYAKISNFGGTINSPTNNPITYCMFDNIDTQFDHGPVGKRYGPYSKSCQLFMADYCANNWDGFCEIASRDPEQRYPNDLLCNQFPAGRFQPPGGNSVNGNTTAGNILIRNAAQRRFCNMDQCAAKVYPFDPNVADSPLIKDYGWNNGNCGGATCTDGDDYRLQLGQGCNLVCSVDPATIDDDVVMNKCLDDPGIALDVLVNICRTSKKNGVDLTGTRIGNFCQQLDI
jgi:hypothetical protein